MDNFSSYGLDTSLMLNGPYAQVIGSLVDDPDPNADASSVVFRPAGLTGNNSLRKVLPALKTTVGVGLRLWMNNLASTGAAGASPVMFCDVNNTPLCCIDIDNTGRIKVHAGDPDAAVLVTTSGPVILANAWHHIETKVTIGIAGHIEVRVDGLTVLDETVNTQNSGLGAVAQIVTTQNLGVFADGPTWQIKDYVIWDGSGSHNNDFLGSVQVINLRPNADISVGWDKSGGSSTGWDLLDDATPDDDSTYISADITPPPASSFELTDLPIDVSSVKAIQTMVRARKTDGGDGQLQTSVLSAGSEAFGTDRPITVAYTYWYDLFETDPSTGALWTPDAVNAMGIKVNRTV